MIYLLAASQIDEWVTVWWPLIIPAAAVIIGGIIAGTFAVANRRGGEKAARKSPLPPTWPEMWARLDEQGRKIAELEAKVGVLEDDKEDLMSERAELLEYVNDLENMVPNPPGLPARRRWYTVEQIANGDKPGVAATK
jgi:hypothetical protein